MLQKELAKRLKARYDTKMDGNEWLEVSSDGIPLCRIKYNGQFLSNADKNPSDEYRNKILDIQEEISTVREYVSVPGIILCIVGIWIKTCLYIGCAVLGLNLILSIVEQSRIRNAAVSHSENPEFNELMDAFCSPDGLQAVGKVLDEKIKSTPDDESEKGKDQ